jgi:hypothetical protein
MDVAKLMKATMGGNKLQCEGGVIGADYKEEYLLF